jgi:hypothetical protein
MILWSFTKYFFIIVIWWIFLYPSTFHSGWTSVTLLIFIIQRIFQCIPLNFYLSFIDQVPISLILTPLMTISKWSNSGLVKCTVPKSYNLWCKMHKNEVKGSCWWNKNPISLYVLNNLILKLYFTFHVTFLNIKLLFMYWYKYENNGFIDIELFHLQMNFTFHVFNVDSH